MLVVLRFIVQPKNTSRQRNLTCRAFASILCVLGAVFAASGHCVVASQGAQDAKKAKVWGTLAKKIVQAAKAGGPDPAGNTKLGEVLKMCKAAKVPKDIIERNLKKATDKSQADYQEVRPCRTDDSALEGTSI